MNYFASGDAADRYADAASRPYFHPEVVRRISNFIGLVEPVAQALDVACGTGQSTAALKEIASQVVGTDISEEMLAQAPYHPSIRYVRAPAEDLPFAAGQFDLITVALALHWLDRARFLSEARRVLRPAGWLIFYDNGFSGKTCHASTFDRWFKDDYLARYPSPPRDKRDLTETEAREYRFRLARRESYANEVAFSVEELAAYLTTQSNVLAAIEGEGESLENAHGWLRGSASRE